MKIQILFAVIFALILVSKQATFKQKIIEGKLSGQKDNIFRCLFDCLYDKIDLPEALRIIGKCVNEEEPLPCFAQELGEHLYQCVSECYQSTEHAALTALEGGDKCPARVEKVRAYFAKLSLKERKALFKKSYTKLNEKYPNVGRGKVGFFLLTLYFNRVPAKVPCKLYRKHFKNEKNVGPIEFEDKFSKKTVEDKPSCPEKVGRVRKYFRGLKKEEKKDFVKKLFKGLTTKYPNVDKKKVAIFMKTLLFSRASGEKVCGLYKKIFKGDVKAVDNNKNESIRCVVGCLRRVFDAEKVLKIVLECKTDIQCYKGYVKEPIRECADKCFNTSSKKDDKPTCADKVTKARAYFKGLDKKEKVEFVKKLYKKLTETYPEVPRRRVGAFIKAFLFSRVEAAKVCKLYKRIFRSDKTDSKNAVLSKKDDKPTCADKVTKARAYFKGLDKEGKIKFVKKLYKKLTETYPEVPRRRVGAFIKAFLFSRVEAAKVCELYKRIFRSEKSKKTFLTKYQKFGTKNEYLRCVYDCLVDKLPIGRVLEIIGKCFQEEDPLTCFAAELAEPLLACVSGCFGKNKKINLIDGDNKKCTDKVKKVRGHFNGLDASAKKEFFKKVVSKLTEKYPNSCKRKVGFFTASLLFNRVPAAVPCKLYKKFFK